MDELRERSKSRKGVSSDLTTDRLEWNGKVGRRKADDDDNMSSSSALFSISF